MTSALDGVAEVLRRVVVGEDQDAAAVGGPEAAGHVGERVCDSRESVSASSRIAQRRGPRAR